MQNKAQTKTQSADRFMKLARPMLAEFGFADEKELIKEQLILMLEARISHYEAETKIFEDKYRGRYEKIVRKSSPVENFDLEDDLNDWRFALEAIETNRKKLREFLNA